MKNRFTFLALTSLIALPGLKGQVTVFSDDFASGTPADSGYYAFGTASGAGWTISSGEMVNSNTDAPNTTMLRSFNEVSLADIGDEMTLTWTYMNNSSTTPSGVMRVELLNLDTTITADNFGGANPTAGHPGFGIQQTHGTTSANVRYDSNGSDSGGIEFLANAITAPNNSVAGTLITYEMRIIRSTAEGLNVWTTIAGGTPVNNFKGGLTGDFYSFNTFQVLGQWTQAEGFSRVGNVTLTTSIPEAGHYGVLVGVVSLAWLVCMRRRNS